MPLAPLQGLLYSPRTMSRHERPIEDAHGKLGVLLVGLGAVSSTFIAGVELIKKGIGKPIGSLTQLGTIRLGKRTEKRTPPIRDFVPLVAMMIPSIFLVMAAAVTILPL